jgi:hypothetical protein
MREGLEFYVGETCGYLGKPHWKVDPTTDCWMWQRATDKLGYGRVGASVYDESLAHRVVFQLVRGPIEKGLVLDHLCKRPGCVNPAHLEPVTQATNNFRGSRIIDPPTVHAIRIDPRSSEAVAAEYGLGINTVVACRSGASYGPLTASEATARESRRTRRWRKLSDADIAAIRASDANNVQLARMYGVTINTIRGYRS